jgi:hypothetical protein
MFTSWRKLKKWTNTTVCFYLLKVLLCDGITEAENKRGIFVQTVIGRPYGNNLHRNLTYRCEKNIQTFLMKDGYKGMKWVVYNSVSCDRAIKGGWDVSCLLHYVHTVSHVMQWLKKGVSDNNLHFRLPSMSIITVLYSGLFNEGLLISHDYSK